MTITPSQTSQLQLFIDANVRKDLVLAVTGEAAVSTMFEVFNNHKRTPRDNNAMWIVNGTEWVESVKRFASWAEQNIKGTYSLDVQTIFGSSNVTIHITCSRKDQLAKAFEQCGRITHVIREEAKAEVTKPRPNTATVATLDMTYEDRKVLAAACSGCGGWTTTGGMSQYAATDGCTCLAKNKPEEEAQEDRGAKLQEALNNNQRTMRDTNELDDVRHLVETAVRQLTAINHRPCSDRDQRGLKAATDILARASVTVRNIQDRMDKTVTAVIEA